MWRRPAPLILCALASVAWGFAAAERELPPGPMHDKARVACLSCHDARIITQQQLNRAAWSREVDKMTRWGAAVSPEDKEPLIDYLVQNFPPRLPVPSGVQLAPGPGEDRVRAACLGCHGAGTIAEEKLNRREWSLNIDKMVRWGAVVKPDDRGAILDYLASHYGVPEEPAAGKPATVKK